MRRIDARFRRQFAASISALLALAIWLAPSAARADDDGFFSGFPAMRLGVGWTTGTWCGDLRCRTDPAALLMHGEVRTRRGWGAYSSLSLAMSVREACIGFQCGGGLSSLASVAGGVSYADDGVVATAGAGFMWTGSAFDALSDSINAVQLQASVGHRVATWGESVFAIRAHGATSALPWGTLHLLGLSVLVGFQ